MKVHDMLAAKGVDTAKIRLEALRIERDVARRYNGGKFLPKDQVTAFFDDREVVGLIDTLIMNMERSS